MFVVAVTTCEPAPRILRATSTDDGRYVLESATSAELVEHLRAVSDDASTSGGPFVRALVALLHVDAPTHRVALGLSPREHAVLRCLAEGRSYKEVAADLGLQIDTVRTYVRALYRKLDVHSVAAAVSQALRQGLV